MTEKNASFNFLPWVVGTLAIVAILLIYNNSKDRTSTPKADEEINEAEIPSAKDSLKEGQTKHVAFLSLSEEEIEALPKELGEYYKRLAGTKNYASGLSLIELNEQLMRLINGRLSALEIDPQIDESEMKAHMEGLKINPRVSANHFSYCGRAFLKQIYLIQDNQYPKLSSQIRSIKAALGDIPATGNLQGHGNQLRKFYDETFLFFYLIWEDEKVDKSEI